MIYFLFSIVFTALFFLVRHCFFFSRPSDIVAVVSLGFVIIIGFFLGKFFKSIGFPEITGYLVTGMLLSPYSFGLLSRQNLNEFDFLKELAITFIALQSGMEIKVGFIKKYGKEILKATIIIAITVFAGIFIISALLLKSKTSDYITAAVLLGILLVLKSPLSTIAIIKESNTNTIFGNKILGISILKDIIIVIVFAITIPFLSGNRSSVVFIMLQIFGSVITGVVVSILISLYMRHTKSESHIFFILIAFLISQFTVMHLDPLIISIIVGFTMQNFTYYNVDFQRILNEISPVLYLLFFALADAGINLKVVLKLLPVTTILIAAKWLFTEIGIILSTEDKSMRKYGTFGLLTQSGLSLALIVLVEKSFPQIGVLVKSIVISVIVITDLFAPVLFKNSLISISKTEPLENKTENIK